MPDTSRCGPIGEFLLDPTHLALEGSRWRKDVLPDALCAELGRTLLLSELQFSEWILRRVEKVTFERDRSVSRTVAIEMNVRSDAPVFIDQDGRAFWLVPLSMMRRRNLVNLDIRDEHQDPITIPGIRLTQQLDESIQLAAASAAMFTLGTKTNDCFGTDEEDVRRFITNFIAGSVELVEFEMDRVERIVGAHIEHRPDSPAVYDDVTAGPGAPLPLLSSELFRAALYRFHRNFTLYVFLPVSASHHRLLFLRYDEPTHWKYQRPRLTYDISGARVKSRSDGMDPNEPASAVRYRAGDTVSRWELSRNLAAFGLRPTRIRFQVPGAENAASYHFEATAPHGVRIVGARLLAGRPNDPTRHVSVDHVNGHSPTVALHAVEVPNGSLCRVQLDLSVPTRGWLTTTVLSCWLVSFVLLSVWFHMLRPPRLTGPEQVTNVVLLLVTASAGVATLIAQGDFTGVAARMLARLRAVAALATSLPVFVAGCLIYQNQKSPSHSRVRITADVINALTVLSLVLVVLASSAWLLTWRWENPTSRSAEYSSWDHTRLTETRRRTTQRRRRRSSMRPARGTRRRAVPAAPAPAANYLAALEHYNFDSPAVGIQSAEGWHERYAWSDDRQVAMTEALDALSPHCVAKPNDSGKVPHCGEVHFGGGQPDLCAERLSQWMRQGARPVRQGRYLGGPAAGGPPG
jgi:hypothetical protein